MQNHVLKAWYSGPDKTAPRKGAILMVEGSSLQTIQLSNPLTSNPQRVLFLPLFIPRAKHTICDIKDGIQKQWLLIVR